MSAGRTLSQASRAPAARSDGPLRVAAPEDALERAADRDGEAILAGERPTWSFSQVRLHAGPRAARAAQALGARAFTVGNDVYFGAGQLAPGTPAGRRLLAHELAHTAQQARGDTGGPTVQRWPIGGTADLHERLEEQFERDTGHAPLAGVHGLDYQAWLMAPRQAAIEAHAVEQTRVYRMIEEGGRQRPDPTRGPFDNETLFRNSCELIVARRFRTSVLTPTHDATTRAPGQIAYFDRTVTYPDVGGEYGAAGSLTDTHVSMAPAGMTGIYQQGVLKLFLTPNMKREELRSTIVHEVQHAADRVEAAGTANPDPIAPIYRVPGSPPPASGPTSESQNSITYYNDYQSEFRAYWLQAEEGSASNQLGSASEPAYNLSTLPSPTPGGPRIRTHFANRRQERIFWQLALRGYDFVAQQYAGDPAFKAMVDAFSSPVGGNLINSVRILELGDAIDACDPDLPSTDPRVRTVRDKLDALDAIDRAFLSGSGSGPFWRHAMDKLPRFLLAELMALLSPPPPPMGDFPPDPSMPARASAAG